MGPKVFLHLSKMIYSNRHSQDSAVKAFLVKLTCLVLLMTLAVVFVRESDVKSRRRLDILKAYDRPQWLADRKSVIEEELGVPQSQRRYKPSPRELGNRKIAKLAAKERSAGAKIADH